FAVGWWIMIDTAVNYPSSAELNHVFHVCGVVSTVGFILLNVVPLSAVRGDEDDDSCSNAGYKALFFFSCVSLFASVIVSSYILFGVYIVTGKHPVWPGIAVFLQNVFISIGFVWIFQIKFTIS
ncbi:hypothetical protein HELRODRAFT_77014, partial [Helobdella robusta]|uniref:Transmembrane protein 50A n=1 Tax=Helobdella robusta TaxID=6412 RepID=T1G2S4_HELRO